MESKQDVVPPSTPEWRPRSTWSGAAPSTAMSSQILSPDQASTSTTTADESTSMAAVQSYREIAPDETVVGERLTKAIALCGSSQSLPTTASDEARPQLSMALQDACVAIRFNAKWFAPEVLRDLLRTALEVAGKSQATTDLHAALDLIDCICTYSLLPETNQVVQFIAYSYYQGSRSNRHKRLSEHAWAVARRILESHLGDEFILQLSCIVDRLRDETKYRLGGTIGAMMIITQRLLADADPQLPVLQPMHLLVSLEDVYVASKDHFREQFTIMLGSMLHEERISHEIAVDGGLDIWLQLSEQCTGNPIDQSVLKKLLDGVKLRLARFEARHHPRLARLFVEAKQPIPDALSDQLLVPWQQALLVEEDTILSAEYRTLLQNLCDSPLYLKQLENFISTSVTAYFQAKHPSIQRHFVSVVDGLIKTSTTYVSAADILASGLVSVFSYKTQKEKWEAQRNWLYPTICGIANYALPATEILLSIRADAAGDGYLELQHTSESDTEIEAPKPRDCNIYGLGSLSIEAWIAALESMLLHEPQRWDVYDAVLTGLAPQIRNHALWRGRYQHINTLRRVLCDILNADCFVEPPPKTGKNKSYVIGQLLQILTATVSFHNQLPRNDTKAAIITIMNVAGSRDHTVSIQCIHALTIICYELPELMAGYMDVIITKMARMVTQRYLALYVLEFFAGLSRYPDLQDRLRRDDFKKIFGVCHSYLQSIRSTNALERKRTPTSEQSSGMNSTSTDDMAQYVYALAHHVIAFWYMALKREDRHGLKEYITSCLRYADLDGKEHIEDQGLVTIDLMDRVDAEESITTADDNVFETNEGRILTRHRVTGLLLITTETSLRNGTTVVTIRRPSGTAQRVITPRARHGGVDAGELASHFTAAVTVENDDQDYISVFPDDVTGRTYGKVAIPRPSSALGSMGIITLPEDDAVRRAIQSFDRTSALDSHKAGIIYVGEGQRGEREILLNVSGSPDYREFLEDMGTLRKLRDAKFNSQGLDRANDADGGYTIVWNNDATELVYHITTFMPNIADDPDTTVVSKKRHIGNDFVNIVFNNSGAAFRFDTFPSAFNYVYIVISPSERTSFLQARELTAAKSKKERFYNVRVLTRPGYPSLSSAGEVKVISGASLGGYVRNLALNACVFAVMWQASDEAGEYPSSWRQRLHMIRRLYRQYQATR